MLKLEDIAHIEHQNIPQTSAEYSQGTSAETIKTTGKQEVIHSSTNATNKHIPNCDQGSKGPETSQLSSVLATIPQEPGEVAEVVHQGTIYRV